MIAFDRIIFFEIILNFTACFRNDLLEILVSAARMELRKSKIVNGLIQFKKKKV